MVTSTSIKPPLPPGRAPLAGMARALLKWFAAHARDLPWRRTTDPYAIWISEVMLQQTQVKTVIPYWERWMRELPSVRALAEAGPDRVLKLWEGLGYYSRARNLQRAARVIMERHQGKFPVRQADILELPGIGRYTAGAIRSIAFDQPEAILDGNIVRVLTRLFAWSGDPKAAAMQTKLWAMSGRLVVAAGRLRSLPRPSGAAPPATPDAIPRADPYGRPHNALNQSLMELGATLCAARAPACDPCPLHNVCLAHRRGIVEDLPTRTGKAEITARRHVVFVLQHRDRYFIRQRAAHGVVNAGLWEFPHTEVPQVDPRELLNLAAAWIKTGRARAEVLGTLVHHITRYRHELTICRIHVEAGHTRTATDGCWRPLADIEQLALAGAHRKIARRFLVDSGG